MPDQNIENQNQEIVSGEQDAADAVSEQDGFSAADAQQEGVGEHAAETRVEAEAEKQPAPPQNNFRSTIYGLAGVYLIYLAYQLYQGIQEEGAEGIYIYIGMVVFFIAGVYLVWRVLRFYLVKPKEEAAGGDTQTGAQQKERDASAAGKTSSVASSAPSSDRPGPDVKAVILAAGKGTRMKSDLPKVLHEINGKPMALYVKEAACGAGAQVVCYVIGYQKDRVRIALADRGVTFAVQEEQLGTGHAVRCAKNFIGTQGDVFVLCGDTPLITAETLRALLTRHRQQQNAVTALSAKLDDPYGYGRIIRDEAGNFLRSVEEKDATDEERQIKESNVGMYVFRAADLYEAVDLLTNDNAQGEYYLPDTLMILRGQGKKVDAYCIENTPEVMGVNTPEQLAFASGLIRTAQPSE